MTNYDMIKNMSVEEMAEFLSNFAFDSDEPTKVQVLSYLNSEVSNGN